MLKKWFEIKLWKRILLALVLGIIVGSMFGEAAASLKWIGDVFIRLIRMIVVPLVFVTLVSGVVAMGNPSKLASIGAKTMGSFLLTSMGAITIGLFLAFLIQPGDGVSITGGEPQVLEAAIPLGERMMNIIPSNPVAALAEGDILAVIFFALLLGVGIMMAENGLSRLQI